MTRAPWTRRQAVTTLAALGGGAFLSKLTMDHGAAVIERFLEKKPICGRIVGAPAHLGHKLLDQPLPPPAEERQASCVIVGGGVAGLSAAWWLRKQGVRDIQLLELDDAVGGNSRSGQNAVSAYPWGAHYVPIPGAESAYVQALFTELGVIRGNDNQGLPIYDEYFLCSDPQERLYINGRWQEGLVPRRAVSAGEAAQFETFFARMREFRYARGTDGLAAFAVPSAYSSHDSKFRQLDQLTMASFLQQQGWNAPHLLWYVNYCMRDDFGCTSDRVSAWAGVHYFAARRGLAANAQPGSVLTWPEGNGWLVHKLRDGLQDAVTTNALVYRVIYDPGTGRVAVSYLDTKRERSVQINANAVIVAAPHFVAERIVVPQSGASATRADVDFSYAPWMTANITVRDLPETAGAPLAWDNVSYHGESLGYVNASQQTLSRYTNEQNVLTYYLPLSGGDPSMERRFAAQRSHADWVRKIVLELLPMHPGIERHIEQIDVWLWGHGMIRPVPGFIGGNARLVAAQPQANIFYAHSDLSGLSLFEEAQYFGVTAANQALPILRARKGA